MKQPRSIKFGIGFFAGLCASLFPRLVAELTTPDKGDTLVLFSQNYLLLSLVFSIFIGAVITIFEWESARSPKDIFMSALAVPAILAGALNTTATVGNIKQLNAENLEYQEQIQSLMDIPTLPPTTITPLSMGPSDTRGKHILEFSLIRKAHAAPENIKLASNYGLGFVQEKGNYVVVLGQANSQQEAKQKATILKQKTPVKIVKSNSTYLVVTTTGKQSRANALKEAIQLKTQYALRPSLQEIR